MITHAYMNCPFTVPNLYLKVQRITRLLQPTGLRGIPASARIVVDDGDEVVADVPLLLVRLRILLVARHQGSNVESHLG